MVVMGRCDCCGVIRVLHGSGDYVICDDCEKMLTSGEEECPPHCEDCHDDRSEEE